MTLDEQIKQHIAQGWKIDSQSATAAVLSKRQSSKGLTVVLAALFLLLGFVWWVFWLLMLLTPAMYLISPRKQIVLSV